VQTITVTAARGSSGMFSLSEMELLVGSAMVVVVLAWIVISRIRRDRHDPHSR
jgi:hypothetical protein